MSYNGSLMWVSWLKWIKAGPKDRGASSCPYVVYAERDCIFNTFHDLWILNSSFWMLPANRHTDSSAKFMCLTAGITVKHRATNLSTKVRIFLYYCLKHHFDKLLNPAVYRMAQKSINWLVNCTLKHAQDFFITYWKHKNWSKWHPPCSVYNSQWCDTIL
jgi:hypothetical protein